MERSFSVLLLLTAALLAACGTKVSTDNAAPTQAAAPPAAVPETPVPSPSPQLPDLQSELLTAEFSTSESPIAQFDFRNYTYELPRGWQNPDGTAELQLVNGRAEPVAPNVSDNMDDAVRAEIKQQRRIGMTFVTTKFFDVTGDGEDEAIVILKVGTGGSAVPQLVYVYRWSDGKPEVIWPFRTGDRADGGLRSLRSENGQFVIELYGQDRFILGQTETGRITGDEEQLCCPDFFTRSQYKWNGRNFVLQGKRLTFSLDDPTAPPVENLGDKVNQPKAGRK